MLLRVRKAMQYLVNRDYIAREIYQGQAVPMYTQNSPTDFDSLTVFDTIQQADLRYDPDFAKSEIKAAMTEAGAKQVSGAWQYNDKPVRIKFIIRVEDERRDSSVALDPAQAGCDLRRGDLPVTTDGYAGADTLATGTTGSAGMMNHATT